MLRFKKFNPMRKTDEGHVIIDEPIHYKMDQPSVRKTKEGHVIIDEPITFRKEKLNVKEEADHDETKKADEYNKKHHGDSDDMSEKLHAATAHTVDDDDSKHIKHYTGDDDGGEHTGSYYLNQSLIHGRELRGHYKKTHEAIMRHAKASGHEFHTFSGTSRDFSKLAKHTKDNVFHSPAHISTTHSLGTARTFADNKHADKGEEGEKHLIHVHVKPHDKVLHTSGHSYYPGEHETIIPAGTKLKYHHSSDHHNKYGDHYKVHHFTIHSQE